MKGKEIIIDPYAKKQQLVGFIPKEIISYYSINCKSHQVFMPPGVLKHLRKRDHWDDFLTYYQDIPSMISNPDYAGQNPRVPNSIELYKVVKDYVLIAIKLNQSSQLFMGTFFTLNNGYNKIQGRLKTERIFPFSSFK